jgi:hypothetical protein
MDEDPTQRIEGEGDEQQTRKLETDPTRVMPAGSVPPPGAAPSPPPGSSSPPGSVPPPTGSSGFGDGRPSMLTLTLAALVAAIAGLIIGAFAIGGGGKTKTVTLSETETVTQTSAAPTTTTTPSTTTTTTPSGDVSAEQAQAAAQTSASETAFKAGISLAPGDIDAKCTAEGGATTSNNWSCEVSSQNGQCTGTLTVTGAGNNDTAIEDNKVSCGE